MFRHKTKNGGSGHEIFHQRATMIDQSFLVCFLQLFKLNPGGRMNKNLFGGFLAWNLFSILDCFAPFHLVHNSTDK
jgi:hypothetical protein